MRSCSTALLRLPRLRLHLQARANAWRRYTRSTSACSSIGGPLQPDPSSAPALAGEVDVCARAVGPCARYAGISEQLAAIAGQQRAARAAGRPAYEVVLDVFGVPGWAGAPASGCELADARPFSRPISAAGLDGYKALIESLLALGARQ